MNPTFTISILTTLLAATLLAAPAQAEPSRPASTMDTVGAVGLGVGVAPSRRGLGAGFSSTAFGPLSWSDLLIPITLHPAIRLEPGAGLYADASRLAIRASLGVLGLWAPGGGLVFSGGLRGGVIFSSPNDSGYLGLVSGAEVALTRRLTLGAELQLNYVDIDVTDFAFSTHAMAVVRWYLGPGDKK